jgi:protein-tyrosine phosphatase
MHPFSAAQMTTVIDLRQPSECRAHPNPFTNQPGFSYHHVQLFVGESLQHMPETLQAFYVAVIEQCGDPLAQIIEHCAAAPAGVFFHCQLGKDRTGILSAILLLLAGVSEESILEDYALTADRIRNLTRELTINPPAHISPERYRDLLATHPSTLYVVLEHIRMQHGSIEAYLRAAGCSASAIRRVQAKLCATNVMHGA